METIDQALTTNMIELFDQYRLIEKLQHMWKMKGQIWL
jgi:hypothetical protein